MIEYVIKSGLVLSILLGIYHLWFQKEKMHLFNRFFLLSSLLFGLTIPLMTLELSSVPLGPIELSELYSASNKASVATIAPVNAPSPNQTFNYNVLLLIYGTITLVLLSRFIINLIRILSTAARHRKLKTSMGIIVLLKERIVPHSFLHYTFLNEEEYLQNQVEPEVLKHEFAHIKQKHSVDLIVIEILKAIFWFNPILSLYKKAIQLNHEFLADQAVINSTGDISAYQNLLLNKASLPFVPLACNLNYSITKLRFQMMKKQTSKTGKMIKVLSLIPIMILLAITFIRQTTAQPAFRESSQSGLNKHGYFKGALVELQGNSGTLIKKYEELSDAEKNLLPSLGRPGNAQLETWKDAKRFLTIINFRFTNDSLVNYKSSDFISYHISNMPNSQIKQVVLLTPEALKSFKEAGGRFILNNGEMTYRLPPPVVSTAVR